MTKGDFRLISVTTVFKNTLEVVKGHGQGRCPLRLFYSRSTIYAVEGGVFSLSCKATYCEKSPSKPELIWCKQTSNGCSFLPQLVEFANRTKAILHFGSGTLLSVLQISPVHINHTGIYQCQAKFPSFNPITAMGHLITVLVIKFKMFTPVSIMSGLRGDSLKLRCIVEFDEHLNTTLTVRWTKDNGYCNESLSRHKTSNQTMATDKRSFTLTLSGLQREDAGVYYCCAASQLSAQIIGMGLINVHVHSVNYNLIYFASVLIYKVIALVIIIAVGLTLICKEKRHQQKDDDDSQRSVRKETKNNVIV